MKLILTLTALLGAISLTYGQGNVDFSNGVTTFITTNSTPGGPSTGRILASERFYFALFVARSTVSNAPTSLNPLADGFTLVDQLGTNTSFGRFNGNPDTINLTIVPGHPIASTASFAIVGWSANLGTSFAAFRTNFTAKRSVDGSQVAFVGETSVATGVVLGGGATPVGRLFGPSPGEISAYNLNMLVVPEPGSMALVCLGSASLLLFRRRTQSNNSLLSR